MVEYSVFELACLKRQKKNVCYFIKNLKNNWKMYRMAKLFFIKRFDFL